MTTTTQHDTDLEWLSVADASERTGKCLETVRRALRAGTLPGMRTSNGRWWVGIARATASSVVDDAPIVSDATRDAIALITAQQGAMLTHTLDALELRHRAELDAMRATMGQMRDDIDALRARVGRPWYRLW